MAKAEKQNAATEGGYWDDEKNGIDSPLPEFGFYVVCLWGGSGEEAAETPIETNETDGANETAESDEPQETEAAEEAENAPVTFREFAEMISEAISGCAPQALSEWEAVAAKALETDDEMEKSDGILAVYEAACVLGFGNEARAGWLSANNAEDLWKDYEPREDIFENCHDTAPFEDNMLRTAGWDYITCSLFFYLGQSSATDTQPIFAYPDDSEEFPYHEPLLREDAETACARLTAAYRDEMQEAYEISETDWSEPLLADAKSKRDEILNSESIIVPGSETVLGETYSGTAYYVSGEGNDENDGTSPESAWQSLEKVNEARFSDGDAVFFRRGDTFFGKIEAKTGVSYSAYGEGEKPIITGSPAEASDASMWGLYKEYDGKKIWQYKERVSDCGIIIFDDTLIAQKTYPVWSGSEYLNFRNEPFDMEKDFTANLQFFVDHGDLSGKEFPIEFGEHEAVSALYLRCDEGNPADVYSKIEMSVIEAGCSPRTGGVSVDNLNFRLYYSQGMDCCSYSNTIYQYCEASWCGGGLSRLRSHERGYFADISGGGLLLFGAHVRGLNNYIHDCESKGIAIVINPGFINYDREDVVASGNVVERCGAGIYMWNGVENGSWKFEDILVEDNFIIDSPGDWRRHNQVHFEERGDKAAVTLTRMLPGSDVTFRGNLIYHADGALVGITADDLENGYTPVFEGNTYVQKSSLPFLEQRDEQERWNVILVRDNEDTLMEWVKDMLGDETAVVEIE